MGRFAFWVLFIFGLVACGEAELPRSEVVLGAPGVAPVRVLAEVASDDTARSRGLMFRTAMGANEGMLFVWPEPARRVFWMKNTPLPLDLLFIDHGRVVAVLPWAKPFDESPLDPGLDSDAVLEVHGGFAARHALGVGARVSWTILP